MFWFLFCLCRFVFQTNYTNFDLTKIENKLSHFKTRKVCLEGDLKAWDSSFIQKIKNIKVVQDNCDLTIKLKRNSTGEPGQQITIINQNSI